MKTKWMMMVLVALCGMAQAELVTIGNAGNAADGTTTYGAVGYTYQISKTEVTIAEFSAFTNATGVGGNENYWSGVGPTAPTTYVSLYEAMKYCNWLTSGNVYLGAYQFSGGVYQSTDRAAAVTTYGTVYALPTGDEWYKAAYYKPVNDGSYSLYANGTDTAPVEGTDANYNNVVGSAWAVGTGTAEQNGTFDMMGNVWEWMEDSGGVFRGGGFDFGEDSLSSLGRDGYGGPAYEGDSGIGFRVVAIPEPASAMLVFFGAGIGMAVHRARRSAMRR